jgi:hypothetical protein
MELEREYRGVVDKSDWGVGEWQSEPDKVQWIDAATNLDCLAVRGPHGAWCGYVGVASEHPAFGKGYGDVDVDVHGGLTFAHECCEGPENRAICHLPFAGRTDNVWWLGFDCAHCFDQSPGSDARLRRIASYRGPIPLPDEVYRPLAYVREQCATLAAQLGAMKLFAA